MEAAATATAVAGPAATAAAASLPGDPSLPFHHRLNLLHSRGAGLMGELLLLVSRLQACPLHRTAGRAQAYCRR